MERQTRKRQGLFIKKDAALMKTVSLKDFSFEQICERSLLFHDNPNANLIYQKFHDQEDLHKAIKPHRGLQADVRDPESITPILQPMDFTADWKRQQDRASKRSKGRLDEEDEFELELEIARRKEEEERLAREDAENDEHTPTQGAQPEQAVASEPVPAPLEHESDAAVEGPSEAPEEEKIIAEIRGEDKPPQENFKTQKHNLDAVGQVIKTLNDGDHPEPDKAEEAAPRHDHDSTDMQSASKEEFIPVATNQGENPEGAAMEEYEAQQIQREEKYKKIYDEAKAEGFEAGFKEGEAKGVVQLQDLTSKVTSNVAELINELSALKRNILESAEENFMQVCQALAESLIEQEFSINPESFKAVIRKAIGEAMPDDKFKVRVHPAFLEHLKKTDLGDLAGKMIADEHIEPGSFKVESELSTIEGDLKQIIGDLLEAAQGEIFSKKTEEAG